MDIKKYLVLAGLLMAALGLTACGMAPTPVASAEPAVKPQHEETNHKPLGLPGELAGQSWAEVVAAAAGQEVDWWMWGGSESLNRWVNGWLADQLKQKYTITLRQVPVASPTEFINQVLGEKEAGQNNGGTVDFMWINGENFRTMQKADLLYGPWAEQSPAGQYYNWNDPAITYDFGYPVAGYEMPWGAAQVVLDYNSARTPNPPQDMKALVQWIKDNPGRFTYPAPPDFTGSVWVRHMCYYATGGYQQFLGDFDQALFDQKFPACWVLLNDLEPYLWRKGQTYPNSRPDMVELLANGEIDLAMGYHPGDAQTNIKEGVYPATVRTYVLADGTIANTNYLAIAYNAKHLAAAVVTANFLASPEGQLNRMESLNEFAPLAVEKLPQEDQARLAAVDRGEATLSDQALASHRLPELQAAWLTAIEEGWRENVLQK
jgi:putative spermidine/putrescine transport system substrate-binding protein